MAKKKGSYNPFYIPSLDALKSRARQAAQAQIDAAVGALPKPGEVQGQFDKSGREYAAMDTAYTGFLRQQQTAAPAMRDTNVSVMDTPAGGYQSPDVAHTSDAASNALAMQGFGFDSARTAAIMGAGAKANENQQRNRRQLNDALLELTKQTAAEKAKFGALYQDALDREKDRAFQAYQAYLGNQQSNAQLDAQVSNQQAGINIDQQNADIRQQNANTAADKAAAASDPSNPNSASARARARTRAEGRRKANDAMQKAMDEEFTGPPSVKTFIPYTITITQVDPDTGKTHLVTLGQVQALATTSVADVKAQAQRVFHISDAAQLKSMAAAGGRPYDRQTPGATSKRSWSYVYNRGWHILTAAGWTKKTAQRLARQWLADQGFNPPSTGPPGSHGPGK